MTVPIREDVFIGLNAPARVRRDDKEMVKSPCPNHKYRSRAKRMGQTAEFCGLCLNQQEMVERWKNIRKAFITIRSSTRKSSVVAKPPVIAAATKQWKCSIVASLRTDSSSEGLRVLIDIDCGQNLLSNG